MFQSQSLRTPLTSIALITDSDHELILYTTFSNNENEHIPQGLIKYGKKKLYFYNNKGKVSENYSFCLLDFYVTDEHQRRGIGHILFESLLRYIKLEPCEIAYDRPSPKLLSFLSKHYSLTRPDYQPNKYVIYPGYPS